MLTPGLQATQNLTGQITTASAGRLRPSLQLHGRIQTATAARLLLNGLGLRGRATTQTASRSLPLAGRLALTGQITAASAVRPASLNGRQGFDVGRVITAAMAHLRLDMQRFSGQITTAVTTRLYLYLGTQTLTAGRITTAASATPSDLTGVLPPDRLGLRGRITVQTKARVALYFGQQSLATSQITTLAQARLDRPWGLVGRIKTTSWATLTGSPPVDNRRFLQGRITTAATARFRSLANRYLVGHIQTTVQARLAKFGELLSAQALTSSTLAADSLQFRTLLSASVTTASWAGITPVAAIFNGRITIASAGRIRQLPLLPVPEPPACGVDVKLDDYLDLITSEHIFKPRYTQSVAASLSSYVDGQLLVAQMPCDFDIDLAVGEQLDFTGQWIGKTRFVDLGDVFFSYDVQGLGWDESNWRGPFDPPESLLRLDDNHYRLLLYATIAANHWDGAAQTAYIAWDTLFSGTGYQVMIQDFGNMTMMLALRGTGHIDAVTQALFQNGHMDLKPEGIDLIDYVFQAAPNVPFFAFDAATDSAAGWDIGYWGNLVPPGQGFIPA